MENLTVTKLKLHFDRLINAHYLNVDLEFHQLMFFISKSTEIKGIIENLKFLANYGQVIDEIQINDWVENPQQKPFPKSFFNWGTYQSKLYIRYLFIDKLFNKNKSFYDFSRKVKFKENIKEQSTAETIIKLLIEPLVYYICEHIELRSIYLNLLTRYKKKREWFYREKFFNEFVNSGNNEKFLDLDLRSFLFENGVEYPFSTASSPSGRADIVSDLEKKDSLVLEVKFIDKDKNYSKARINEGYSQIVKYTSDYNKSYGFLVVFNCNPKDTEVSIDGSSTYPSMIEKDGRRIYIIIININPNGFSASKIGKINYIDLKIDDLISKHK